MKHTTDEQVAESKPRLARMYISDELLRSLLPLPETAKILGSQEHEGEVVVVVSAPEFPELDPGDELPIVAPRFTQRGRNIVFAEWGL